MNRTTNENTAPGAGSTRATGEKPVMYRNAPEFQKPKNGARTAEH